MVAPFTRCPARTGAEFRLFMYKISSIRVVLIQNVRLSIVDSNRYGLTNEDLNRRWSNPNQVYHPVIYHTKGLMEYCARVLQRPPHVFVDYHGHSRRKNVFLFGCSRSGSWSAADRAKPDQPVQYLVRESTEEGIGYRRYFLESPFARGSFIYTFT